MAFSNLEEMIDAYEFLSCMNDFDGKKCQFNIPSLPEKLGRKLKLLKEIDEQLMKILNFEDKFDEIVDLKPRIYTTSIIK